MDEITIKNIKRKTLLFRITSTIGILGVLDISTHGSVSSTILYFFASFLPPIIASTIAVISETLLGFSVLWLVGAWSLNGSIKRLKEGKKASFNLLNYSNRQQHL